MTVPLDDHLLGDRARIAAQGTAQDAQFGCGVLLRHGSVVDHFLHYVRVEGPDSAPKSGLETLNQSLLEMGVITRKAELLTLSDAERIHALTEAVFQSLVGADAPAPKSAE